MTATISVRIGVPALAEGVAFYCAAFGLSKKSEPPAAFCSDPFGHGFCLLQRARKQ